MNTPLPTPEQLQRAKWDLLLTDLEFRQEQLRHSKSYNPVEIEARLEQLRQTRQQTSFLPWQVGFAGMTAGAALFAAGAAFVKIIGG
jgi:hypothetical protein